MNFDFSINWAGFTVTMFSLVSLVAVFVCNKWIKKVAKYYWFWLAIGSFLTAWMLAWRTIPYIQNYINLLNTPGFVPAEHSIEISNALMLDLCPATAFALPLSLVLDPSRKSSRAISLLALCGGIWVCFFQFPTGSSGFEWGFKFFFIGSDFARLYAWMHYWNLIIGFMVLMNTPKFGWKGYLSFVVVIAIYYSYVVAATRISGCTRNVSGTLPSEWEPDGPYGWLSQITHWSGIQCMIFAFPIMFILASFLPYINDVILKRFKIYQFGNARTNKWYIWNSPNVFVRE